MSSRILGQLRESLLAYYFDKQITDAWNAAFRLPNLFRRLLGEGSLSVSFIPVFVDAKAESHERAQNLINSVYSFLLLVLGLLTAFGILVPEPLLNAVLDPSYIADHEKYLLTLRMTKIMFGFIFFVSSYAFVMGILNALGQFAWPALAPTFLNVCMIISTVIPEGYFAVHGDQLAYGVLIGGAVQFLVLIPALIRVGYLPKLTFNYKNPDFLRVLRNMLPGLAGMGLLQFATIVNLRFSSSLVEGTISYINYVDRLVELPLSLISVSLGTALLPVLSGYLSQNEKEKFGATARYYLELNMLMSLSAAAGLFVLAEPLVDLLFGHGRFTSEDVHITAHILKTYCWIMIFSSGVRVLTPAYFAMKNTWFPAIISAICLILHLIMAPILIGHFQVYGLMMSTTLSACLNLTLLLLFYRKLVGTFDFKAFAKNLIIYLLLAVVTGACAHIFFLINPFFPTGKIYLLATILFSIAVAITAFVSTGYLFKVQLVLDVVNKVLSRLKLKRSH